jgi:hypothetical protein
MLRTKTGTVYALIDPRDDRVRYIGATTQALQVLYQPAGRFWAFQAIEASVFVGLAAALLGVAIWRLNRRT